MSNRRHKPATRAPSEPSIPTRTSAPVFANILAPTQTPSRLSHQTAASSHGPSPYASSAGYSSTSRPDPLRSHGRTEERRSRSPGVEPPPGERSRPGYSSRPPADRDPGLEAPRPQSNYQLPPLPHSDYLSPPQPHYGDRGLAEPWESTWGQQPSHSQQQSVGPQSHYQQQPSHSQQQSVGPQSHYQHLPRLEPVGRPRRPNPQQQTTRPESSYNSQAIHQGPVRLPSQTYEAVNDGTRLQQVQTHRPSDQRTPQEEEAVHREQRYEADRVRKRKDRKRERDAREGPKKWYRCLWGKVRWWSMWRSKSF